MFVVVYIDFNICWYLYVCEYIYFFLFNFIDIYLCKIIEMFYLNLLSLSGKYFLECVWIFFY